MKSMLFVMAFLFVSHSSLFGQAPTEKDVPYDDDHSAQCLDLYLAKSDKPVPAMIHIHGGGWRAGSKAHVPGWLLAFVAKGQLSVVSIEYRFTDVAPHPAQVNDCLRAIQFVRTNAARWNIDSHRIGVTGGSAGGHLTAYVALHDDVANPDSPDLVERESSRVTCGVSFAGPTDWSLLSTIAHQHPAYRQLIGYAPGTAAEDMSADRMKDVSPITFATHDDPPLMQVHGDKDDIVPLAHAERLHKALQAVGAPTEMVIIPGGNHGVAGAGPTVAAQATEFVKKHLLAPR
ncbi:MAG: alpha/beta hydrolase [Planctomycetaceae bacterium]|nr:alpha/beta hydrolase [Planctomycetaceae bacterium]